MYQRKSGLIAIVVALTCLLMTSLPMAMGQQWTQWRGPDRSNHCLETSLFEKWGDDGPEQAWTATGLGRGYGTVSVVDGKIFVSGNTETAQQISAYDLEGTKLWSTPITDEVPKHSYLGSRTTPTWHQGKLYSVTSNGRIVCLDSKAGKLVWARDFSDWSGKMMTKWGYAESPLVDGDVVICTPGGPDGMVVALNLESGEEVWSCKLPEYDEEFGVNGKSLIDGAGYSSAVVSEGGGVRQYVQLVGRGLIGIRAKDGKLLWRYKKVANGTANIPTAIVDGDHVFTSTGYNTGSALLKLSSADDGVDVEEVYWLKGKKFQNKLGGMTLVDGHIYCKWGPIRAKGKGESAPLYADGHFIWRRQDGLVILTTTNTEEMEVVSDFMPDFQEDNSWAQPVIANGVMYLREQDKLMAYKLK